MSPIVRRLLLALALACIGYSAHPQGFLFTTWMLPVSGCAGLPGDCVPGALNWYGLRAYSNATKGTAAVRVCDPGSMNCVDMLTDVTTGNLIVTTVGGSDCSMVTCTVLRWYDQAGSFLEGQDTEAQRPVFKPNCLGSHPCLQCTGSSSQLLGFVSGGGAPVQSQPFTFSSAARNISGQGGVMAIGTFNGNGYRGSNTAYMYSGTIQTKSGVADNTWHALQTVFNHTSSIIAADGSSSTVSPGSNGNQANNAIQICRDANTGFLTGNILETGWWPFGFTTAQIASMNASQHSWWGF